MNNTPIEHPQPARLRYRSRACSSFEAEERASASGFQPASNSRASSPSGATRPTRRSSLKLPACDTPPFCLVASPYAQDILCQSALRGLGLQHGVRWTWPDNGSVAGTDANTAIEVSAIRPTSRWAISSSTFTDLRDKEGKTTRGDRRQLLVPDRRRLCGPCRFGTYVTEYRKALRDAGFDGFRVMLFQQQGGLKQATGEEVGVGDERAKFFVAMLKSLIIIGDVLNALMYRIRPYEVERGRHQIVAVEECKSDPVRRAFETRKTSLIRAHVLAAASCSERSRSTAPRSQAQGQPSSASFGQ